MDKTDMEKMKYKCAIMDLYEKAVKKAKEKGRAEVIDSLKVLVGEWTKDIDLLDRIVKDEKIPTERVKMYAERKAIVARRREVQAVIDKGE